MTNEARGTYHTRATTWMAAEGNEEKTLISLVKAKKDEFVP